MQDIIFLGFLAVCAAAMANGVKEIVQLMVAKREARKVLAASRDPELLHHVGDMRRGTLSDIDFERMVAALRTALSILPERVRQRAFTGLDQNQRAGRRAYAADLLDLVRVPL